MMLASGIEIFFTIWNASTKTTVLFERQTIILEQFKGTTEATTASQKIIQLPSFISICLVFESMSQKETHESY